MEDWAKQIDTILAAGGNEVLQTSGNVTAKEAKEHAETEFEKCLFLIKIDPSFLFGRGWV